MPRPRRLYISDSGKYYYLKDKKRVYIKVPEGISNKQVQKINIANIIQQPTARRVKRRKKRGTLKYEKNVVPGMIPKQLGDLPVHFFTPGKNIASLSEAQENKLLKDSVFNFDFMKTLKDFTDNRQKMIENKEEKPVVNQRESNIDILNRMLQRKITDRIRPSSRVQSYRSTPAQSNFTSAAPSANATPYNDPFSPDLGPPISMR